MIGDDDDDDDDDDSTILMVRSRSQGLRRDMNDPSRSNRFIHNFDAFSSSPPPPPPANSIARSFILRIPLDAKPPNASRD